MMPLPAWLWSLTAAAWLLTAGLLAGLWVADTVTRRRSRRTGDTCEEYLRRLLRGEGTEANNGAAGRPGTPCRGAWGRRVAVETLAEWSAATCGVDPSDAARIVTQEGLDRWLLRRINRTRGFRRAYYLLLLSRLPLDGRAVSLAGKHLRSRHRWVRFCALLLLFASDHPPLEAIGRYPTTLSPYDCAEVIALLRRGLCPLPHEPLLQASRPNFRRMGVEIVRQMGIEAAQPKLLRLIDCHCEEVTRRVLYTLCSLHLPMNGAGITRFVQRLPSDERWRLLRYMARMGYSSRALDRLATEGERPACRLLVNSYKSPLVCG